MQCTYYERLYCGPWFQIYGLDISTLCPYANFHLTVKLYPDRCFNTFPRLQTQRATKMPILSIIHLQCIILCINIIHIECYWLVCITPSCEICKIYLFVMWQIYHHSFFWRTWPLRSRSISSKTALPFKLIVHYPGYIVISKINDLYATSMGINREIKQYN